VFSLRTLSAYDSHTADSHTLYARPHLGASSIWQWALVGDLTVKEMNVLELEMLWLLKFSLTVLREEYDECVGVLKSIDDSSNDLCSQLDH